MSSSGSGDRSKRQKSGDGAPIGGPPNPNYHQPPHPYSQHFRYGGPPPPPGGQFPPMQHQSGYMWQQGQQQPPPPYGNQPVWPHGHQPPPQHMGMYRQGGPPPNGMPPEQAGNWNGFRGPPQQGPPPMGEQSRRSGGNKGTPPRKGATTPNEGNGHMLGPHQQQGYWGQQQWPQPQWGGGPPVPPMWQGGPPPPMQQPVQSPPPMPQHMQGQQMHMSGRSQKSWPSHGRPGSDMASPARQSRRPRGSADNGGTGYVMPGSDGYCKPISGEGGSEPGEMEMYMSRGPGSDESKSKGNGGGEKDKGRGSYRCGRCGAPKKGHVCPYQPKLKRRPDEPPPETRNAAVQVEMDEFMTLRRLNIEIQGFAESYATGPQLGESMVVGEPHPLALTSGGMTHGGMGEPESRNDATIASMRPPSPPGESDALRLSPRSSPASEGQD